MHEWHSSFFVLIPILTGMTRLTPEEEKRILALTKAARRGSSAVPWKLVLPLGGKQVLQYVVLAICVPLVVLLLSATVTGIPFGTIMLQNMKSPARLVADCRETCTETEACDQLERFCSDGSGASHERCREATKNIKLSLVVGGAYCPVIAEEPHQQVHPDGIFVELQFENYEEKQRRISQKQDACKYRCPNRSCVNRLECCEQQYKMVGGRAVPVIREGCFVTMP